MFKKRVKISNSHAISNKDKKNMKALMTKLGYDEDAINHFFDDKNYLTDETTDTDDIQIQMDKI